MSCSAGPVEPHFALPAASQAPLRLAGLRKLSCLSLSHSKKTHNSVYFRVVHPIDRFPTAVYFSSPRRLYFIISLFNLITS